MDLEIQKLTERINKLEGIIFGRDQDNSFSEKIRDIIFFDQDVLTATTRLATDTNGDSVTVPKNPTKFFKVYYKGQVTYIPAYINP